MNARSLIERLTQQEDVNFLFSNRIPRRLVTRFMGWWSRIEHPWICNGSIALWRLFSELDLSEAKTTHFKSLHDCFTRELKPGARRIANAVDKGEVFEEVIGHPDVLAEVRGEGLLIGVKAVVPSTDLVTALRDQKLLTVGAGDNVVRLLPPLIVTEAEIEEAVQRLDRACTTLSDELSKRAATQ